MALLKIKKTFRIEGGAGKPASFEDTCVRYAELHAMRAAKPALQPAVHSPARGSPSWLYHSGASKCFAAIWMAVECGFLKQMPSMHRLVRRNSADKYRASSDDFRCFSRQPTGLQPGSQLGDARVSASSLKSACALIGSERGGLLPTLSPSSSTSRSMAETSSCPWLPSAHATSSPARQAPR